MQTLPLWHLHCFRRSFCGAISRCQPNGSDWQRRAPSAPVFRSRTIADSEDDQLSSPDSFHEEARVDLDPAPAKLARIPAISVKNRQPKPRSWSSWVEKNTSKAEAIDSSRAHHPTLLEELFPHETASEHGASSGSAKTREIPRRPLAAAPAGFDEAMPQRDPVPKGNEAQYKDSHVLVIKNAAMCLSEDDFRRLVPGSGHLEGWNSSGDLIKVIRGRDTKTLDTNGDYYLLFRNGRAAEIYKKHVRYLHRESQQRAMLFGGFAPPAPPELGDAFSETGIPFDNRVADTAREVRDPLAHFTLALPTQRFDLRLAKRPFAPLLRQIMERGGYPRLVRNRLTDHEVLLTIEGMQPSLQALQYAISEDGRQRQMRWNIAGTSRAVREIAMPRRQDTDGESLDDTREGNGESEKWQKVVWKKWIVPCKTANESERFIASWHRRDIRDLLGGRLPTEEEVVVNAELV